MLYKIITIPFKPELEIFDDESFQKFIINKKIHKITPNFFNSSENTFWTVFIEYEELIEKTKKEDFTNEPDLIFFDKLKKWRKGKADEQGIPLFLVATNDELREIVFKKPDSVQKLKDIRGFGVKKVDKYGKELIKMVKDYYG